MPDRQLKPGDDIRRRVHDTEEYGVVVATKIAESLQGPKQFLLVVNNTRLQLQQEIEAHMILPRKLPKTSDKK